MSVRGIDGEIAAGWYESREVSLNYFSVTHSKSGLPNLVERQDQTFG